ncbi:MAG: thioredoxin-dependent thiol peroxidase [Candidatus Nomurabacteria bacterium]|nr:thioredoxin-dependent thiol peroxidase [Candidatus Nomurabacteria bacterium]
MLENNTIAPAFSLLDQDEQTHTLADYAGKWVLVYFYPKDDTPGCTAEACAIRDAYNDFEKQGIVVLGISKDSPKSHKKFADKYELPFILLSDPSGGMISAYDSFKEKSMFGKTFMGINRGSYLINPDGIIARVYPKVDPANHAGQILIDAEEMMK